MIGVSVDVTRDIQVDLFSSILNADTKLIEKNIQESLSVICQMMLV